MKLDENKVYFVNRRYLQLFVVVNLLLIVLIGIWFKDHSVKLVCNK